MWDITFGGVVMCESLSGYRVMMELLAPRPACLVCNKQRSLTPCLAHIPCKWAIVLDASLAADALPCLVQNPPWAKLLLLMEIGSGLPRCYGFLSKLSTPRQMTPSTRRSCHPPAAPPAAPIFFQPVKEITCSWLFGISHSASEEPSHASRKEQQALWR